MSFHAAHRQALLAVCASLLLSAATHAQTTTTAPTQPARQNARDCCVRLTASVHKSPPGITIAWQPLPGSTAFIVSRSAKDGNDWAELAKLTGSAKSFDDSNVAVGVAYEYRVLATVPTEGMREGAEAGSQRRGVPLPPQDRKDQRVGFILSGIELPPADSRGKVLLLIETSQAKPLATEIDRLAQDLVGDGWSVIRQEVPGDEQPPAVRQRVRKEYDADPNGLKAVFIIGHLAVPRSGDYAPDGHSERRGAQPADVY